MGMDKRRDHVLHKGDRIRCGKISYIITGPPIGYGGSAVIYPARRTDTQLYYAIKECFPKEGDYARPEGVILPRDPGDTRSVRLLDTLTRGILREQRIGQNIHNAGDRAICIREVLNPDSVTTGGKTFDQVRGGCFAVLDRVDRKSISFDELLEQIARSYGPEELERTRGLPDIHTTACIMEEILMALEQVQTARDPEDPGVCGYYFGDLHGGNIYFSGTKLSDGIIGTARLMDFGSARELDGNGFTRMLRSDEVFSAPGIRPPEMLRSGCFRLGADSDLYSAGCLMARCVLTKASLAGYGGQLCIRSGTITQDEADCIGCRPEQLPLLSEILEKATAQDRSARYRTAAQMLKQIRKLKQQTAPRHNRLSLELSTLAEGAFVGRRRELRELEDALAEGSNPIVLYGFPGMGKTELAIKFGQEQSSWSNVYFVRFAGSFQKTITGPIADAFSDYSKYLPTGQPKPEDQVCREVLQLLAQCARDDILIIDHADSPSGIFAELRTEEYHRLCALPMHLLLTTRSERDDVGQWVEVGPLADVDLFKLMTHRRSFSRERLLPLLEAVGRNTLMVELMTRTMEESWQEITPEVLLDALETGSGAQMPLITTNYDRGSRRARLHGHLKALFDLSGMGNDEVTVLCCATLLSSGGIDVLPFKNALREEPERPRSGLSGLFRAPQPSGRMEQSALSRLTRIGWLTVSGQLLRIPPLVRELCRSELKPDTGRCAAFLEGLWKQYTAGALSAAQCGQAARCFAAAAALPGQRDPYRPSRAGQLFSQAGMRTSAVKYARLALETARELVPEDALLLAALYNNLGAAWGDQGDSQREMECYQLALKLREAHLPPDHLDLAVSYSNLGTCCSSLGQHQRELEYQQKALQIRKKWLPPEDLTLADSYSKVGLALCHLGRNTEGMEQQKKALRAREDRLPPDDLALAASHTNLITPCRALKLYEEVWDHAIRALQIREAKLPPLHPDLAQAYHNAGYAYRCRGNRRNALKHYLQCLDIRREILEGNDPRLLRTCAEVVELCRELEEPEKELEYILLQLELQKSCLPEDDAALQKPYMAAAGAYARLGSSEMARFYLHKAAEAGDPRAMGELAMVLRGEKRNEECLYWLKEAAYHKNPDALYKLGVLYLRGQLVARDLGKGIRLLEQASELGDKRADRHLGRLFLGKFRGLEHVQSIDPRRALYHLSRAADPQDRPLIELADTLLHG